MTAFHTLIKQLNESLNVSSGVEFSRAKFPEGEINFKEKVLNGQEYIEMHVQIKKKYQGKGYATKKIKELIKQLNKPAFFSHGRILNDTMYKVFDKIKQDERFEVTETDKGVWLRLKS